MDIKILEETRPLGPGQPEPTDIPCRECGQPLIKFEFPKGFEYACDNAGNCPLFRVPQCTKLKEVVTKARRRTLCDDRYNEQRRANYHELCARGIRSALAPGFTSNKQTKRIKGMFKRGLSAEFINKALAGKNDY